MNFSQFRCPECVGKDLDVLGSSINENVDPALGEITFECIECGTIFVIHMEAEVLT